MSTLAQAESAKPLDTSCPGSSSNKWSFPDALVLILYVAILAFAIHHYLPFSDEAQEWLIARDSTLTEMLGRRLHYEGHAGLWACFLWVLCRLHVPYAALNWIGGALALPGIYVLLRYSPFPRLFRILLPFTFFLQYQYAAIARPYVIFPLLIFLLSIVFTLEKPRPVLFGVIAGLLANISFHGAVLAVSFCGLYLYELYRRRDDAAFAVPKRAVIAGAVIFACFAFFAAAVAFPAPDAAIAYTPSKRVVKPNAVLGKLVHEETLPASAPKLDPALDLGSLALQQSNNTAETSRAKAIGSVLLAIVLGWTVAAYPIAVSNLLALIFLVVLAYWLWNRGCLRLMIPWFAVVLISTHVFVYDHHTGQFLLALVSAIWIALNIRNATPKGGRFRRFAGPVLFGTSLVVTVLQIGWTVHCVRSVARAPTDPGRDTAAFLKEHYAGKRIASFSFQGVSMQPYFDHSPFINQNNAYWVWSVNTSIDQRRTEALLQHPDVVVVGDLIDGNDPYINQLVPVIPEGKRAYAYMVEFWETHGYRMTHQFCGQQFRRMGVSYTFCEDLMEPTGSYTATNTAVQASTHASE